MSSLVFPVLPGLTFPVTKTPMWKNTVQDASSGKEVRIGFWSYPKWKYSIAFEVLRDRNVGVFTKGELWALVDFFNRHGGPFDDWLFDDPDDNTVTDQVFGTGNASTTQFQLIRSRSSYNEPVKSVHAITNIRKAGVTLTNGTDYTVDTLGLVTFTTAPASAASLAWTGTYYWRCRFLDDYIDAEKFANKLWQMQRVDFQSVKQ